MHFLIYGLRNTSLKKCLKSPVSEEPLTSDMVNGSKHCWNRKDSNFVIFIDPYEEYYSWKGLSDSYVKSEDRLLTHWIPITSILFLAEAIYCKIFRCIYLRNEKYFVNFFFSIWKSRVNFEHFQKKDDSHSWCIFELTDSEKRG